MLSQMQYTNQLNRPHMYSLRREIVCIEGCDVEYAEEKRALHDVSIKIYNDDFIGVIGPNGGGKTSLIKLITGEISPNKGSVVISQDVKNSIGYLPQYSNIDRVFPISLLEIVLSGLQAPKGLLKRYNKEDKRLALETMKSCGIEHLHNRACSEVSGGELQRALLARAIISKPKLLILDEPNNYVDSNFEKELYELLNKLSKSMAIILVSHDVGTIISYVKSVACVNKSLHYHNSNKITQQDLMQYNCPILLVTHGDVIRSAPIS